MLRVMLLLMVTSVISGCTLPDWKVDNKDKRYAGKWYFYKQRIVQSYQEAMSRCFYGEITQETENPLKFIGIFGFTNITTGKNVVVTLRASSEKENSGQYSYEPPLEGTETLICGEVEGVRILVTMGYSEPCPDNDLGVWVAFEKRRNSTHPPTPEEQKKMDECLKRNKIDLESLSLLDNDNCTN